jgi:hypothetical protein
MVRPSAWAVFMLMMSSNCVGCTTGNSAGLVPLGGIRGQPLHCPCCNRESMHVYERARELREVGAGIQVRCFRSEPAMRSKAYGELPSVSKCSKVSLQKDENNQLAKAQCSPASGQGTVDVYLTRGVSDETAHAYPRGHIHRLALLRIRLCAAVYPAEQLHRPSPQGIPRLESFLADVASRQ